MTIWILSLPLAFLLFATAFFITHKISPFRKRAVINNPKSKTIIYSLTIVPLVTFILLFTDLFNDFTGPGITILLFASGMLAVISADNTLFLSKKHKWNQILVGLSGLVGVLLLELAVVVTIVAGSSQS